MLNFLFNDELGVLQRFYNNRSMKNLVNVLVFSLGFGVVHAQSKKEMIVLLNSRVDSLNEVVSKERIKVQQLRASVEQLEKEKSALDVNLETQRKLKDAQIKSKQDSLALVVKELLKYKPESLMIDVSGPIKTVTIGKQVWMLENLNVATFKNGVAIPEVQSAESWKNSGRYDQAAAWCYYDNDPKNGEKYGKLYNWYAVVDKNGLCPQGWHVPSDTEWESLLDFIKENPNKKEDNLSVFTSLLAGIRYNYGNFDLFGVEGNFWSSTYNNVLNHLSSFSRLNFGVANGDSTDGNGLSVRCLRD
jgi:uncharacterized protein (TIGR02145 family)